jgi:DNA-binding transcriptional MerR regulator
MFFCLVLFIMEKKYYSIREVADQLKVPQSTLRFWEKEIHILQPGKSAGGTRRYVQKDIDLLKQIKFLIEDQHLTLAGVNERLATHRDIDEKRMKVIEKLKEVRKELQAIRLELNAHEALAEELIVDDNLTTENE